MASVLITTIEDAASGIRLEVYAEDNGSGGVLFEIKSVGTNTTNYDLNGFFVDIGNDGGALTSIGTKSNNMNGSSADGIKLDGFDAAAALGSVGGNDANWTVGTFTINGLAFADLDGAQIGIRATSVGEGGAGSLKLVGDATIPDDEPTPDHFPEWDSPAISHITLYWRDDDILNDDAPNANKGGPDGWFTVKFNYAFADPEFPLSNDLDNDLGNLLDFLVSTGDITEAHKDSLVGVAIKGGQSGEVWYDLDENPADVDTPPADIAGYPIEKFEIDQEYDWNATSDAWALHV